VFIPYLKEGKVNSFCVPFSPECGYVKEAPKTNIYGFRHAPGVEGPDICGLPSGMAAVPVNWEYRGTQVPLSFRAGFVGAAQRPDGTIAPEIGWCICRSK
jgi:hypothetical protein